jgi:hypothetical protein
VRDVAPLQINLTRRKLADLPQARVAWGDASDPETGSFDVVTCFFLLHEVPDAIKRQITQAMLGLVRPGDLRRLSSAAPVSSAEAGDATYLCVAGTIRAKHVGARDS